MNIGRFGDGNKDNLDLECSMRLEAIRMDMCNMCNMSHARHEALHSLLNGDFIYRSWKNFTFGWMLDMFSSSSRAGS